MFVLKLKSLTTNLSVAPLFRSHKKLLKFYQPVSYLNIYHATTAASTI